MGCSPTLRPSRAGEFSLRVFFILWQCGPVAMCVTPPAPTMPSAVIHPDASHGIPGVELFRVQRGHGLTIDILPTPASWPGGVRDLVEARWAAMLQENPRLYSGPLLSVVALDLDHGVIHTVRDEFKRLAVQPQVKTGVQILSVTGVITARDTANRNHVLLGRRGRGTRIYGGMWELGPAGGIPPPHASTTTLTEADAVRHLAEEAEEELGLKLELGLGMGQVPSPHRATLKPTPPVVNVIVRDTIAHSDDLTILLAHDEPGSMERLAAELAQSRATHAWEYEETRWIALAELAAFDAQFANEIIITSRAVFRGLGWVK